MFNYKKRKDIFPPLPKWYANFSFSEDFYCMCNGKNKHVSMFSSRESLKAFFKVENMEQNYFSMSQYVLMPSVCINYLLKMAPGGRHRRAILKLSAVSKFCKGCSKELHIYLYTFIIFFYKPKKLSHDLLWNAGYTYKHSQTNWKLPLRDTKCSNIPGFIPQHNV